MPTDRSAPNMSPMAGCNRGGDRALHAVTEEDGDHLPRGHVGHSRRAIARLGLLRPPCLSVVLPCFS
ncbi:peptidase [Actinidia rufa]|uniref:Peptidase n=1 Tax=Actinidia rufa TaxID=165716 RepID=A0A7J0GH03_9ERIC|nr:peptidase [Actinidia rufa]